MHRSMVLAFGLALSIGLTAPHQATPDFKLPTIQYLPSAIKLPALPTSLPTPQIDAATLIIFPPLNPQDLNTVHLDPETSKGSDNLMSPGRAAIRSILEQEAKQADLPPDIAEAVVRVESGYDPNAIGKVGEIGLMQVRPSTAAMLGFHGTWTDLAKPEVNLHYGVKYLGQAWHLANGDLCRALMKYRAGHGEENMTPLSVDYCQRARGHLAALGSALADIAASSHVVPLFATYNPKPMLSLISPTAVYAKYKKGTAAATQAFWSTQEARVRAINAKLEAKWHRHVASR